jgi:hypothetical protein
MPFPTKRKGKLPAGIPLFPKLLPVINLYIIISFKPYYLCLNKYSFIKILLKQLAVKIRVNVQIF